MHTFYDLAIRMSVNTGPYIELLKSAPWYRGSAMLATDSSNEQSGEQYDLSDEIDTYYSMIYESEEGVVDAFIIFTPSFSVYITDKNGTIISKDITIYRLDTSSDLQIIVYTSNDSLFILSFSDAKACSACKDKLLFCHLSASTDVDGSQNIALPVRSTSTLCRTEVADPPGSHPESLTAISTEAPPAHSSRTGHVSSPEILCLYMHTSVFDESFTHVFKLFCDVILRSNSEITTLMVSPMREDILNRTLTNLSAYALYPMHNRLYTHDLIGLFSVVNAFILYNVTLPYELLSHDIRVTDPPGAHLRGRTPKDSFSIEKTAYPYHSIRYLDILQQVLNHRVISFSSTHQRVVLSDDGITKSIVTSLVLYFDSVCGFIGIFFGAPALAPLKRFFSASNNVELNVILSTSLYLQLQEILEFFFIVLSGCLPRKPFEHLLEFDPHHSAPTFSYQVVKQYLLSHLQNGDILSRSHLSHSDALGAIVYAHKDHMSQKDVIYNLLYLSFIILDTFNQAATLDASVSQLVVPDFSEKDSCLLFSGLLSELDANIVTLFLSFGLENSGNGSLVKELLFGDLAMLLSANSVNLDYKKISEQDVGLFVDSFVCRASKRFWSTMQPLIMLLRALVSIFKSSSSFLFEFNSDLCLYFMNCVLLIFMDQHLDLLHRNVSTEAEHWLVSSQKVTNSIDTTLKIHALLAIEMLLRDFLQRISHVLVSLLEVLVSIYSPTGSPPTSLLHRSCYRTALLGSVYLGRRLVRFSRQKNDSSPINLAFAYTDTCLNSIADIFKQLTSTDIPICLDLTTYLILAQHLVDFLDDSIECTFEVSAIKVTIVSGLISLIAKFLPQVPDGLNDSEKDPVMSLSLGLDLISTLDIRSLLAYSSQKGVDAQSVQHAAVVCCTEQARLLSRFVTKLIAVIETSKQNSLPPPSLPVDLETSMTVNMLDLGCNGIYDQPQLQDIIRMHLQVLLSNLATLYDHLRIHDFVDSFLAISKDSVTYSADLMNKAKQLDMADSWTSELCSKVIDSAAHMAKCLVSDVLPLLNKDDLLLTDTVDALSHILPGCLLLSLCRQLTIARTVADFYRPNGLFETYLHFVKADYPNMLLSSGELRILLVAIDAQGLIFRTLSRNADVLRETIAAYEVLNLVSMRLRKGNVIVDTDEVSTSAVSSHRPQLNLVSHKERYSTQPITVDKISRKSILSYLDSLSATFSYIAQRESSSVEVHVLILSAILSLFECMAPTNMLQSEAVQLDELVDLRSYLESGHEVYSEVLLEEARNLFRNKTVLSFIYRESNNKRCNPHLLSVLSTAVGSTNEQLKELGISLLYQCLLVITLKSVPGEDFFSFTFNPDMCAYLLSTFTTNIPNTLIEHVLAVFDIGLQFLYELDTLPAQKRKGLTSLVQYQASYSKLIDTLTTLISNSHLSIAESFYLRLFPFLTSFMVLFNRLNLFKKFSTSFNALINTLIETAMPDYRRIQKTHDPLPLLFSMANTLYIYLCMCMHEETFAERPHNTLKSRSTKKSPILAHDINHLALSAPADEASREKIGTVVITICTLLLNCFQSISETVTENNDISFKKAISILYNLSHFGFAGSDCVYILLYTYVGTVSHVGLLQMSDKDKEYDMQVKCVVRIFKALTNVMKNPCHSVFVGESLTSILFANGNDFLVLICVCLAVSVKNAAFYKSLVQPYENLVRDGGDNPAVPRWLSLFRLVKRTRSLADPIDSMVDTSLEVLHYAFGHLIHKPAEQSMFTVGPGKYLLPLLLHCFINNFELQDNETLASRTDAYAQAELPSQKPNKHHAQMAVEVLAMSMRVAPMQASAILISKNTLSILKSSFEELASVFLKNGLKGDNQGSVNQSDDRLDNISMAAGALGEILSIYTDMAMLRECSNIFRESNNNLLVLIAELLQQLAQYYKTQLAGNQGNPAFVPLHIKVEKCMTLAVLTLRNIVITAEDLSYITTNIRGTKAYVLISGMYEYITLHTGPEADMAGLPAAIEYLTIIIMHLITQAEEAGTDHHAIALIKKYALQLEQKMQSALRKDIYVEECSALLGALNMLP